VDGTTTKLAPELPVDPTLMPGEGGRVALDISEPDAVVFVDGAPRGAYAGPLALPSGRHRVRIERADFFPFERDVDVPRGSTTTVRIELEPTPQKRVSYRAAATSQRTWGWVGVGAGAAVVAGSAVFLVWNYGKQRDADDRSSELRARTDPGGDCDASNPTASAKTCARVEADLRLVADDKDAVNSRYPWGFAALGVGALGAGIGTYLLLSNDDPNRYEPRPESDVFGRRTIVPVVQLGSGRALLGVSGSF
jgi:hypothetical protein